MSNEEKKILYCRKKQIKWLKTLPRKRLKP